MSPIRNIDPDQKATVCKAFKRIAAAFRLDPKLLAKEVLKEFAKHPPASITFVRPSVESKAVKLISSLADLPAVPSTRLHENQ